MQETGLLLFELWVNKENASGRKEKTSMAESWEVAIFKSCAVERTSPKDNKTKPKPEQQKLLKQGA